MRLCKKQFYHFFNVLFNHDDMRYKIVLPGIPIHSVKDIGTVSIQNIFVAMLLDGKEISEHFIHLLYIEKTKTFRKLPPKLYTKVYTLLNENNVGVHDNIITKNMYTMELTYTVVPHDYFLQISESSLNRFSKDGLDFIQKYCGWEYNENTIHISNKRSVMSKKDLMQLKM